MRLSNLMLPDIEHAFRNDPDSVRELFADLHAEDVADIIEAASPDLGRELMLALDPELAADVLECIEEELQPELVARLGVEQAATIVEEMSPDDRADIIGDLSDELADALLARMDPEEAADVRALVAWEEGTVGSVMSTDFITVPPDMHVAQVIERVRQQAQDAETVYYVYVVAEDNTLVGVTSLRHLILNDWNVPIRDFMVEDVKVIGPDADQEEAAHAIGHYDLIGLPVIDGDNRLVGVVTVDDVVDVMEEEATEDIHRIGAVQPLESSYFGTSFWTFVRKRAPWLVVLFLGGLLTGNAVGYFSDLIDRATVLVVYLPLVIASGGNSGSQSATLIIRALAVREVTLAQAGRVLIREALMGIVLGLGLAVIGIARVLIAQDGGMVAVTVGLTLVVVVIMGTVLGSMLPILLERLGMDPAVSSTPFIASLVDVVGIVSYMTLASWILGLG